MVNYQNGKIYKIESIEGKCMYIGSTCQKLSMRLAQHRREMKTNSYCTSRKVLKYEDAKIYLIELHPCNIREELLRKEGEYIKILDCVNKNVAGRTSKEYQIDNKEKLKIIHKNWKLKNKEKIKDYMSEYIKKNEEKIKIQTKKYRTDNKEKLKIIYTNYRNANKEKIKEHKLRVCECECGKSYTHTHKSRHMKSKKHLNFITENP